MARDGKEQAMTTALQGRLAHYLENEVLVPGPMYRAIQTTGMNLFNGSSDGMRLMLDIWAQMANATVGAAEEGHEMHALAGVIAEAFALGYHFREMELLRMLREDDAAEGVA